MTTAVIFVQLLKIIILVLGRLPCVGLYKRVNDSRFWVEMLLLRFSVINRMLISKEDVDPLIIRSLKHAQGVVILIVV